MTEQYACSRRMAALILEKNERTIRRWCDDGVLQSKGFDGRNRAMILIDETLLNIEGKLKQADDGLALLIAEADQGSSEAQCDLGVTLLREERYAGALALFQDAAAQFHPDAMHWLYHCYDKGLGTDKNEAFALMWLGNAAAHGHVIAKKQISALTSCN